MSPKVVHYYDQDCQIMARRVELDITHAQAVESCSNQECVAQALGGVVAFAASAVVSGSIAVVGNAVYWLERTSNCKVKSPQQG
ncbi:MAG TPA: hypothetical protein VFU71_11950 [Burkholderiaceae bacterium]|nr:hypothetical protein [Burkholderiaceae bacterium]